MTRQHFHQNIKQAILNSRYRISNHAYEQAIEDNLTIDEICDSVINGELIEEYRDDFPLPSCLIYGDSHEQIPIHSVWAYNKDKASAVLITVYRPNPQKWIDFRQRR